MHRTYRIADTAEVLLFELHHLLHSGPNILIHHAYQLSDHNERCGPGEEIASAYLLHRGRAIFLALPLSLLFVLDSLARSRHIPRSATQIASSIRASEFYRKHGRNSGIASRRKISRSAVKVYVQRIRRALDIALREAGIGLAAEQVLVSKKTVSNQTLYQLHASVSWHHSLMDS
jgi:hypothetical protein